MKAGATVSTTSGRHAACHITSGKRRYGKRQKMQDARKSARRLRYPKRRAPHIDSAPLFTTVERPAIFLIELPGRIVRRSTYNANLVAVFHEPAGHFS